MQSLLDQLGVNLKVVAVQAAIFAATFVVLSNLLFKRVLGFIQAREKEQASASATIAANRAEAARLAADYEAKIAQVEKEAYAKLQEVLKEALAAKTKIVSDAQQQARAEVEAAQRSIEAEKSAAMGQLKAEVARLAVEAAGRILDEPIDDPKARQAVTVKG